MSPPRFSVIVPTYNRPDQLGQCVSALMRVIPPEGGFEICVVNDGGSAPSVSGSHARQESGPTHGVTVIHQVNSGPGAARNTGVDSARGKYLAFTDDDCRPSPNWLRAFDRVLLAQPDALVAGRTVNALQNNLFSTASQLLVDFVTGYFNGGADGLFFASSNIALRRSNFLEAGGFDTLFSICAAEDREFVDRWWAQGRPFERASDAVVLHAHALTLASFSRQQHTYGRGAVAFRRLRRERSRPQRVDPRFYFESLRHPFRCEPPLRAAAIASLTAVAHAAYFAGLLSATEAFRSR